MKEIVMAKYTKQLFLLCLLFLMVGSLFSMNDILLPSLVGYFKLSYTQATLIQFTFYSTYIIFPIPIAWMIQKYGYKVSLIVAIFTCSFGCALFIPAKFFDTYPVVLMALFVISTGLTIVNVAANPLICLLGEPEGAHQRINFVQAINRIGCAVIPLIGTGLIYKSNGAIRYHFPYMILAVSTFLVGLFIYYSRMPSMKPEKEERFAVLSIFKESIRYKHLFFGFFAMFFYVGADACTVGFFIPYLTEVVGLSKTQAAQYLTIYYIFTAVMGLAAVFVLRFVKAHKLVGFFGIVMILFYLEVIFLKTNYNMYVLSGLGLFLSIMFPTIFSLAIEDLGDFTGKGSALLNFAIVGGSVFPLLQGMIADKFGVNYSYIVPCFCFFVITLYAFFFTSTPLMSRSFSTK